METTDNVQTILNAGMALAGARRTGEPNSTPYAVVPPGATLKDLSEFLEKPLRVKQRVALEEVESFIRYVTEYSDHRTRLFAEVNENGATITAVLDYHTGNKVHDETEPDAEPTPGWCKHVAEYTCPLTVEWKRWTAHNGKPMEQTAFAEFIEQNQLEVVTPPGAELLEIAQTLKAKSNVDFLSGLRLSNGQQQLQYMEATSAQAGVNGNLSVPEEIELGIPVFQGGPRYSVKAFLRYRISNKKLNFHYVLFNPHKVIEHAAKAILEAVETGTKIEPFMGRTV